MKVHEYHFRVEWGDTDAAGIVFNPNYYKWMDEAIHYYFESIGFPLLKLINEDEIGMPVVESKCSFHRPLYYADHVILHTTILDIQRDKVMIFAHEFYKNGQKVAEGSQTRVLADISKEKLKAISIPVKIKEAILASEVVQPKIDKL